MIKRGVGSVKKADRSAKKQREDQALNRVLWWFGGAVVLEFFLLLLNRFYFVDNNGGNVELSRGLFQFLRVFAWIALAAAVALGVLAFLRKKKGGKTLALTGGCVAAGVLALCAFVAGFWGSYGAVRFLYVCVPVAAVLALVYYLYQREFFLVALQGGAALFALWFYYNFAGRADGLVYAVVGVVLALTAAAVALFVVLQRNKGALGKARVLPRKSNYLPLYLAAGVTVLALLAALIFGLTVAYGAIFGVVAWLFGAAIYYTVRLM